MKYNINLAYVYLIYESTPRSIYLKVCEQYETVKAFGLTINFIVFTNDESLLDNDNGIYHIFFQSTKNTINVHKFILDKLNEFNYDVVVLRRLPFTPFLYPKLKNKSYKLISEHHTKELPELISKYSYGQALIEKLSAKFCFKYIDGIVSVTDEIRNYEISRGFKNVDKSLVVGNGINVKDILFTGFAPFDGKELNMIFMAGSLAPWHGLDRLLQGLRNYNNEINIRLHLVGNIDENYVLRHKGNLDNVVFHGVKTGYELADIFADMNIGISSLAMHRKGMKEACDLKSREYLSHGIPFVKAYKDPDINSDVPFCKTFQSNEEPINIYEIIEFVQKLNSKWNCYELSNMMRNYAYKHIDWKKKMQQYVEFAKSIK